MPGKIDLTLAELLCARLCHDLAGPVGGIGTGTELLSEETGDPALANEALMLLANSAKAAAARLHFLRLALGTGSATTALDRVRAVAADYFATSGQSIAFSWQAWGNAPLAAGDAKLALNLLLLAQDCLPRGGSLALSLRQPGGAFAEVVATAPTVAQGQALSGLEAEGPDGLSSRAAQGYYASRLATDLNYRLETTLEPGRLRLLATMPTT